MHEQREEEIIPPSFFWAEFYLEWIKSENYREKRNQIDLPYPDVPCGFNEKLWDKADHSNHDVDNVYQN